MADFVPVKKSDELPPDELITGPISEDVLTYEAKVEGGTIYVKSEPNDD